MKFLSRLNPASKKGAAVMILLLVLAIASCPAYRPQKQYHSGVQRLPDSLRAQMSVNVDESKIRQNWGKLKRGMSPADVEWLLGKPPSVAVYVDDDSTTWCYDNHYVVFDNTKEKVLWWEVDPPAPR
jgi:hypothetical protein